MHRVPSTTMGMECLESRIALSASPGTATLNNGELLVCGTDADNQIFVGRTNMGRIFVAGDFLETTQTFDASEVTSVRITGGAGNDTIFALGMTTPVTIEGEAGNDSLAGGSAADVIRGGAGNDTISGLGGNDMLFGDDGIDRINGGDGDDMIEGGAGSDFLLGNAGDDNLVGNDGDDQLFGLSGDDTMFGGPGDDILVGASGDDVMNGGLGDDILVGDGGNDTLRGDDGDDTLLGSSGDDDLVGGDGNDRLVGQDGADNLTAGANDDFLFGDAGEDNIDAGDGDDTAYGGSGTDTIIGMGGRDGIVGGLGGDVISGGDGQDNLWGGLDRDVLIGGRGADNLNGQEADDVLFGGSSSVESDLAALSTIGRNWQSTTDSYDDRISNVQQNIGAVDVDDSDADNLVGEGGQDVFVSDGPADMIPDKQTNEVAIGRELVALNDSYTVAAGQTLTTNSATGVLQNDRAPTAIPGSLTVNTTPVNGPTNGTLTLNTDGSFTYVHTGNPGESDSFAYELQFTPTTGSAMTLTAVVTIDIPDMNQTPVANEDTYAVDEDTTLTRSAADGLLDNDTDADGDALTVSTTPVAQPSNGTVTINADGSFTYQPNPDFNGDDSFTYRITDPDGETSDAKVAITVNSVNDLPVAGNITLTTDLNQPLVVGGAGDSNNLVQISSDVEGDSLTATLDDDPTRGNVTINQDGSFTYTPDSGFEGTDSFTFRVNDGQGRSLNSGVVTINVVDNTVPNVFNIADNLSNGMLVGTASAPSGLSGDVIFDWAPRGTVEPALQLHADDHISGDPTAPNVLVEYLDFACPACRAYHPVIESVKAELGNELMVVTRHFPRLTNSLDAAIASEAAAAQGRFDEMADAIFAGFDEWTGSSNAASILRGYANGLGLNMTQYDAAVADPATAARVNRDATAAQNDLGATGTPTFYLNNNLFTGAPADASGFVSALNPNLNNHTEAFTLNRQTGEIRIRDIRQIGVTDSAPSLNLIARDSSGGSPQSFTVRINTQAATAIPELPADAVLTTLPSGLQVYDFNVGTGASPSASDSVEVAYTGYLPNGTIFDSNANTTFPLPNLIAGFSEGVQGMQVGGMRRIVIPPELGYGSAGNPGAGIGGTDTIVFDVVLFGIA